MKKTAKGICLAMIAVLSLALNACSVLSPGAGIEENRGSNDAKPITLTLWHIWTTDIDANRITLEAALEAVKASYPYINIDVDSTETETYKTRIKTSIAVNDAPDIFFTWGGGFSEAFVDTGKVLCMDKYYTEDVERALPREFLQFQTYHGSIYGFPFMRAYAVMYANKEIFEDNSLGIPTTYNQLLAVSRFLSDKGITTIAVAGQDMWPLMFHYATLAMREVGPECVTAALSGEGTFNQQGFIRACNKLLELKHAGAFGANCLSQGIEPVVNGFMAGNAALYYHISCATGGFKSDIPINGAIVPLAYPGTGGPYDNTFLGGAVDSWMVSADTHYPDEAASVIILLARTISTIGRQTGMTLPMWSDEGAGMVQLPGYTSQDYAAIKQTYDPVVKLTDGVGKDNSVLWWDTYLGKKGTHCNELIVQMFTEELTPEQFVIEMDNLVASGE